MNVSTTRYEFAAAAGRVYVFMRFETIDPNITIVWKFSGKLGHATNRTRSITLACIQSVPVIRKMQQFTYRFRYVSYGARRAAYY